LVCLCGGNLLGFRYYDAAENITRDVQFRRRSPAGFFFMAIAAPLRFLLVFLVLAAPLAGAHQFWVNTSHFVLDRAAEDHGEVASEALVYVALGHVWPFEEPLALADVTRYVLLAPSGVTPLKPDAPGLLEVELAPKEDGPHVVCAAYKPHFVTGYKVDGETKWVEESKAGKSDVVFSGHYDPYAKALLQVGPAQADHFTKPVGDAIELVPELNPYTLTAGAETKLEVKVLFRGAPLANQSVFARVSGDMPRSAFPVEARTNAEGVAELPLTKAGVWLLKTTHTVSPSVLYPDDADEEGYEASLTFELK
jgi:uncharacterized GH25 family protein